MNELSSGELAVKNLPFVYWTFQVAYNDLNCTGLCRPFNILRHVFDPNLS